MVFGDQWVCLCGWSNIFLRERCRNCSAPRPIGTVRTETAMEIMQAARDRAAEGDDENAETKT